ncbi:hypothetical protein [Actinoplanes sp. NPDC026623]|uniref:hypothetical protein n=1 Tax=Actinoplanes sp. NPDC026623 TaxID=3155610 RepID=UPI0034109E38
MRNTSIVGGAMAVAAMSALLFGVVSSPAQAAAASCYGGSHYYNKPAGSFKSTPFTTTTACSDINVRSNQNTFVRVCFRKIDIFSNCQARYTHVVPGQYVVVATNVLDNRDFLLDFYNDAEASGLVAA